MCVCVYCIAFGMHSKLSSVEHIGNTASEYVQLALSWECMNDVWCAGAIAVELQRPPRAKA